MTSLPPGSASRFPLDTLYGAAHMYYLEDATQSEIAGRLGVSRPTVSRLLAEARRIGLVRIEIVNPREPELDALASRLRDVLGIDRVWIAPGDQSGNLRTGLTAQVAVALAEMELAPGDGLLIASGNTLYEVARGPLPSLPGVVLIPTVGGVAEPEPWHQPNEIVRSMAERTNARPVFLFAEAMPSAPLYERLLDDPSFQRVQELWAGAKGALLGVGAPPLSRGSISRSVPLDDEQMYRAVGDVALNFFDIEGEPVEFEGSDRMVRPPRDVLRAIPHTVGIAVGAGKAVSIRGAVRAGLIGALITDERTAGELIELSGRR
ncbi:sugar-binding transcriptional regulator [Leifsonia sp. EB34]|uniref:sugar-binding transcriptional regulator n=1 Tax=Leifsonia sp. EB34 TaxID=3156303 RepID=UPI003511A7CB